MQRTFDEARKTAALDRLGKENFNRGYHSMLRGSGLTQGQAKHQHHLGEKQKVQLGSKEKNVDLRCNTSVWANRTITGEFGVANPKENHVFGRAMGGRGGEGPSRGGGKLLQLGKKKRASQQRKKDRGSLNGGPCLAFYAHRSWTAGCQKLSGKVRRTGEFSLISEHGLSGGMVRVGK